MLNRDDLIELIVSHLRQTGAVEPRAPQASPASGAAADKPRPKTAPQAALGRRFVSEHELRKMVKPGVSRITLPQGAIISPLALDWLVLKGITVDRE